MRIRHIITTILGGLLGLLFALPSNAQVVNFVSYGVEHGLAQSQVSSLVQDEKGRLWVGTIAGLSVWDGQKFTNYNRSDSLAEDWVTASYKDKYGHLWFGHWGGSITKYDKVTEEFESIKIEKFNSYQEVKVFVEDTGRNVMFFGTDGSGLFYMDLATQQVKRIEFSKDQEARFIKTLFLDSNKDLWIGTENHGVYIFDEAHMIEDTIISTNIRLEDGLSSNAINQITEYNGNIWLATNAGITYFKSGDIDYLRNPAGIQFNQMNDNTGFASNIVSCFLVDHQENLWIGTGDQGVVKTSVREGYSNRYDFTHYNIEQGLSFYNIKTMYLDRENTVWIGTDVGLNQYTSEHFILYDETVGLKNNIVWAVAPDAQGNIWLGTNMGVTQLINADNRNNDSLSTKHYKVPGLYDVPVIAISPDSEGNIWFGTANGALFKRTKTGNYERINIEAHLQDMIYSIAEDEGGNLWLGTRTGIVKIDKRASKLSLYTASKDSIGGDNILKVLKARDGTLWFAVLGGSLTSYDGENFKVWGPNDGMDGTFVLSAAEDNDGNLWFGSYTGGLYKYDGSTFTNYNKDSGMVSATPYAIVADKDNNIWIGSTNGVEKFDQRTGEFTHFSKSEGFLGIESNPNSIAVDGNDNIWFGTILGAVKYNPYLHDVNTTRPIIEIKDKIRVNNKVSSRPPDNTFTQSQNNLTFDLVGVSLNNPNKLRYTYQLAGDKGGEWHDPTPNPQAILAGLNAGNYTFNVKAINADGVESDVASYKFKIEIPFYMSVRFYVLQFAIILIMLALAVFYGRKTGGSRVATILASIAVIIVFEYGINYVEDNVEAQLGSIAFIKVMLNVFLGLMLFPVERFVQGYIIKGNERAAARRLARQGGATETVESSESE